MGVDTCNKAKHLHSGRFRGGGGGGGWGVRTPPPPPPSALEFNEIAIADGSFSTQTTNPQSCYSSWIEIKMEVSLIYYG